MVCLYITDDLRFQRSLTSHATSAKQPELANSGFPACSTGMRAMCPGLRDECGSALPQAWHRHRYRVPAVTMHRSVCPILTCVSFLRPVFGGEHDPVLPPSSGQAFFPILPRQPWLKGPDLAFSGHQSESEKSLGKLGWLCPQSPCRGHQRATSSLAYPLRASVYTRQGPQCFPIVMRGIRLQVSVDRASDVETGPHAELLTTPPPRTPAFPSLF